MKVVARSGLLQKHLASLQLPSIQKGEELSMKSGFFSEVNFSVIVFSSVGRAVNRFRGPKIRLLSAIQKLAKRCYNF
jgi:hypothetical protein